MILIALSTQTFNSNLFINYFVARFQDALGALAVSRSAAYLGRKGKSMTANFGRTNRFKSAGVIEEIEGG